MESRIRDLLKISGNAMKKSLIVTGKVVNKVKDKGCQEVVSEKRRKKRIMEAERFPTRYPAKEHF